MNSIIFNFKELDFSKLVLINGGVSRCSGNNSYFNNYGSGTIDSKSKLTSDLEHSGYYGNSVVYGFSKECTGYGSKYYYDKPCVYPVSVK